MKKVIGIISAAVLCFTLLIGCSDKPKENANAPDTSKQAKDGGDKKEIAVVLMALNSDFWNMVKDGVLKAQKEKGLKIGITAPQSEADVTGQLNQIEDAINRGVSGLIIAPCDPKALIPTLEKAKAKGIPVVLIDSDVEDSQIDLRNTFVGISEFEAGEKAGDYLAKLSKPGDKVGILRGLAGLPSHDNRVNGAKERLEKAGAVVVSVQPADSDRGKAVSVTENMLESDPQIKVLYATNDEMALGAFQACESKNRKDIICGFDGSPDALNSIIEGKLTATLAQRPIDLGYVGVNELLKAIHGEKLPPRVFTEVQVIDKDNVEQYKSKLMAEMKAAEE